MSKEIPRLKLPSGKVIVFNGDFKVEQGTSYKFVNETTNMYKDLARMDITVLGDTVVEKLFVLDSDTIEDTELLGDFINSVQDIFGLFGVYTPADCRKCIDTLVSNKYSAKFTRRGSQSTILENKKLNEVTGFKRTITEDDDSKVYVDFTVDGYNLSKRDIKALVDFARLNIPKSMQESPIEEVLVVIYKGL